MLSSISWQTYLYTIEFSLIAYYSFIAVAYYRYELSQMLFRSNVDSLEKKSTSMLQNGITGKDNVIESRFASQETCESSSNEGFQVADHLNNENSPAQSDDQARHTLLVNLALQLEDELNVLFKNAAEKEYIKEELIMALQQQIAAYSALKDSTFLPSVRNYIAAESKKQCSIHLDAEDLEMLWRK